MKDITLIVRDEEETKRLGTRLAGLLPGGSVCALIGTLGAGKTRLVQAIAEAAGLAPGIASSPTFVLLHEYEAERSIYHFDAYRLESETDFLGLGPEEYFESDGWTFIEWADKFPGVLPRERLEIRMTPVDETSRSIEITALGERYDQIVRELGR